MIPLELKTGPTPVERMGQISHRAQVILYTVMLEQSYRCRVDAGLLYYSANSAVLGIRRDRGLLISLLQQRNAIAFHLSHPRMPDMKRNPHLCNSCAQAPVCVLVHAAVENGNAASSGIEEKFREHTSHLNPNDLKFYAKWDAVNRYVKGVGKIQKEVGFLKDVEGSSPLGAIRFDRKFGPCRANDESCLVDVWVEWSSLQMEFLCPRSKVVCWFAKMLTGCFPFAESCWI